jgi:hypothetical protein
LFVNTERDACETKQYKSAPVAISAFGWRDWEKSRNPLWR